MHDRAELDAFLTELSLTGPVEPFLVFADWLQGRGDPWGELIAVQCHDDAAHRHALMLAGHGLLAQVADRLCPHDALVGIAWQRGFVGTIAFSDSRGTDWLGDELARLLALPAAALVAEVSFTGAHLDDDDVRALLRSRRLLARVPRLGLAHNWFSPPTVAALAHAFPNANLADQRTSSPDDLDRVVLQRSWRGDD
ncbi:MAG: hypothetical protein KF773_20260 [Deltaproteobacteria bacterium]|nr:hypothetical protein [Deltaproteobacteria bacterium]